MTPGALTFLDLFSGIGGFALGLERAGHRTAAFCEILPSCRHLLSHHWPGVPIYDDVRSLTGRQLAADGIAVDAICGGFPCQDVSLAGEGAGLAGEQSGLWRDFARLVREIGPRVVIVENVSALLSRGAGDVLRDLAACGYDAEWDCVPASAVGAPHRRDRLWIVAHARSQQHQGFGHAFRRAFAQELFGAPVADAHDRRGNGSGDPLRPGRDLAGPGGEAMADAHGQGQPQASGRAPEARRRRGGTPGRGRDLLADAGQPGLSLSEQPDFCGTGRRDQGGTTSQRCGRGAEPGLGGMAYGLPAGLDGLHEAPTHAAPLTWAWEPDVPRVALNVPARVDRLRGLGNAVVPEIPFRIGRALIAAEGCSRFLEAEE